MKVLTEETKEKIRQSHIGKKHTPETIEKMRQVRTGIHVGQSNPLWKGDKVGYASLHEWVRNHLPKPLVCQMCKVKEPYEVANISGNYLRDLKDWQWLCRKCHMVSDGRMNNLKQYR